MDIKKAIKGPLRTILKAATMATRSATPDDDGQGVRSVVGESVATSLTPAKLHKVLQEAKTGDPAQYFELAEEMEERDSHYGSVLSTRKLALAGIPGEIVAASENPRDEEIAELVKRDILKHPEFPLLVRNLTAALGRSVAVCEIIWDTQATNPTRWKPASWVWTDPRWFTFDKATRRKLRLKDKAHKDGLELDENKYIVHYANLKPGLPVRSGLAYLAAWSWMLKSYTLKDWAKFCELFGQPLRLGKYGSGASDKDKRALLRAVRSIARDAAAIIPESMSIDLIQSQSKGDPVFAGLAKYLDEQISKAVLGQTMTSDNGSSQAQAEVHNEVRLDLLKADAIDLSVTINRDLIIPYCIVNFGQLDAYPTFKIDVAEEEDLELLSKIWERLQKMGVPIPTKAAQDKFGIPEAEEGETILTPTGSGSKTKEASTDGDTGADDASKKAQNREHKHPENDELDDIAESSLDGWRLQVDPFLDPIAKALNKEGQTLEGFAAEFGNLMQSQDMGPLTDAIATASAKARVAGEADAASEAKQDG